MRGIGPKNTRIQMKIGLIFSVVFLLSGCLLDPFLYPPRSDLEKYLVRKYDNPDEFTVISYVEKYDFLDFVPLEENDSRVFTDFEDPLGSFVRNISQFLINAEKDYNRSDHYYQGELYYIIDCSPSSSSDLANVLTTVKEMQETHKSENISLKSQDPISDSYQFAAFSPQNDTTVQIISSGGITGYSGVITSNVNLTNLAWVVLLDLRYDWSGTGETCQSFEFTEIILLTSEFAVISLFSISSGRIC